MFKKNFFMIYGIAGYLLFNAVLIYFMAFLANLPVPKTVDSGTAIGIVPAIAIDILLMALFGIQHSLMARPFFKRWWLNMVPLPIERSTYVWLSSGLLLVLFWQWQPVPTVVWQVNHSLGYWILWSLFGSSWLFALYATSLIDHFDLLGLRQVYLYFRGEPYTPVAFKEVSVYRYIRHPIMLGTLIGLWATPLMTLGHLLLAIGFSIYIFIGIRLEEDDMKDIHGEWYEHYRRKTSMVMPLFLLRKK
jgi:protein-S-isoprenylcysteine O-methyltransferase Ste14